MTYTITEQASYKVQRAGHDMGRAVQSSRFSTATQQEAVSITMKRRREAPRLCCGLSVLFFLNYNSAAWLQTWPQVEVQTVELSGVDFQLQPHIIQLKSSVEQVHVTKHLSQYFEHIGKSVPIVFFTVMQNWPYILLFYFILFYYQ